MNKPKKIFSFLTVLFSFLCSTGCSENVSDSIQKNHSNKANSSINVKNKKDKHFYARRDMIEFDIKGRGVRDEAVVSAMRNVNRHLFVPEYLANQAYDDNPLPIGYGQTISQPYIVAYMTEKLELEPDDRVLEIGTGSGYQAAVLAEIVKDVFTVEIIPELGKSVKEAFRETGYKNIKTKIGDGYFGWKEHAPYDAIIVTAAAGNIPPPLIKQLKEGGKMIIPVGSRYMVQYLILIEKKEGKVKSKRLLPVRFVPLTRQ